MSSVGRTIHTPRDWYSLSCTDFLYLLGQFEHWGSKDKRDDIEVFIDRLTGKEYIMKHDDWCAYTMLHTGIYKNRPHLP